jgi:hypothetical protein
MPCDKEMELPLEERLIVDVSSGLAVTPEETEYSIRVNPETKRIEYQIPPSKEMVYES